jgi:hypothetical protein
VDDWITIGWGGGGGDKKKKNFETKKKKVGWGEDKLRIERHFN